MRPGRVRGGHIKQASSAAVWDVGIYRPQDERGYRGNRPRTFVVPDRWGVHRPTGSDRVQPLSRRTTQTSTNKGRSGVGKSQYQTQADLRTSAVLIAPAACRRRVPAAFGYRRCVPPASASSRSRRLPKFWGLAGREKREPYRELKICARGPKSFWFAGVHFCVCVFVLICGSIELPLVAATACHTSDC